MKSLRTRLVVSFTALLAAGLGVFGVIIWLVATESMRLDADEFLRNKAMLLARMVSPVRVGMEPWIEQDLQVHERRFMVQVFDGEGVLRGQSSNLAAPLPLSEEAVRTEHPAGGVVIETIQFGPEGRHFRLATHPRRLTWGEPVVLYAQAILPLETIESRERTLLAWLLGGGTIILACGAAAASFLSHEWLRSVSALEEAAQALGSATGDLGRRRLFAPSEDAELAALATAFNQLLDRLESSHTAQQRFAADASHELRTPLTILRGEIEVALRRPREPEEYQAVLASNREEVERLSRLTENLLALAHADAGEGAERREPVNLCAICQEVLGKLETLASEARVQLRLEASGEEVSISGDAIALKRVVQNLVENAIRYSPAGESVQVRLSTTDQDARIEVIDSGIGIAPEHLPHLFERFYRVDSARSRAQGGSGLGLAIVKSLVEAHGGTVSVTSTVGQGSVFVVVLPAGQADH